MPFLSSSKKSKRIAENYSWRTLAHPTPSPSAPPDPLALCPTRPPRTLRHPTPSHSVRCCLVRAFHNSISLRLYAEKFKLKSLKFPQNFIVIFAIFPFSLFPFFYSLIINFKFKVCFIFQN